MEKDTEYFDDGDGQGLPLQQLRSRTEEVSTQKSLLIARSFSLCSEQNKEKPHQLSSQRTLSEEALPSEDKFQTLPGSHKSRLNRPSRSIRRLNTLLLEAVKGQPVSEIIRLLKLGANPNATCSLDCVSACHVAAMRNDEALKILLDSKAEKERCDRFGRTPLHLAAWAGNATQVAILLGLSEDLQSRVDGDNFDETTEEEIKRLTECTKEVLNARCDFSHANMTVPKEWRDSSIEHNCKDFVAHLPFLQPGWTALLAASAGARPSCVRLLLAGGVDACTRDLVSRTALDVAGSAMYLEKPVSPQDFAQVVQLLLSNKCKSNTLQSPKNLDTPLHTAVELESLDAIKALLEANSPVNTLNRVGLTPIHLCVQKRSKELLQVLANTSEATLAIETRDKNGRTALHASVLENWVPGVCVSLEAGAKITTKDNNGETPIHLAAAQGNIDVLNEVLNATDQLECIDIVNAKSETGLFKAVINGHIECVKKFLKEGASITKTLPKQVNVFHIAAEQGYVRLLKVLLDYNYNVTRSMINFLTVDDRKGYGPIHFAVSNNHIDCVKLLLSRNAYVSLRTSYGIHKHSTPLHIAAINNNVEIAKVIIKFDKTAVELVDDVGWSALHTASHHGNRDMIALLLKEGANLSSYTSGNKCQNTAINMIMNNLSKPTNFMEDIFDSYIYTNNLNIQDPNCEVTVDYGIFVPETEAIEQMGVIEALLETGNRYSQRHLLIHPLLESFLYLKWRSLLPFFYSMIALYGMFVLSLSVFIISVFFRIDLKKDSPTAADINWCYAVYVTVSLILAQELLYANINRRYLLQLETWVKLGSAILAIILPLSVNEMLEKGVNWPRHVATMALLLSWLEMTFLLSRFPNWGYYVLMFGKVSSNVIKILLTFLFLVVGFALSFMIEFHSRAPFENPWAAFIKTMVMMTSEFDYDDLVEKEDTTTQEDGSDKQVTSLLTVRLVFLAFLILAAIVLMNLMVGVAVNDLNNLQVLGNIRRLVKQVEFLGSLERLVYNRFFKKILPRKLDSRLRDKKKILKLITIKPSSPSSKYYKILPNHIREALFEKAQSQKRLVDEELGSKLYRKKIDEIHMATVQKMNDEDKFTSKNESQASNSKYVDVINDIKALHNVINEVKNEMTQNILNTNSSIQRLEAKFDTLLMMLNRTEK